MNIRYEEVQMKYLREPKGAFQAHLRIFSAQRLIMFRFLIFSVSAWPSFLQFQQPKPILDQEWKEISGYHDAHDMENMSGEPNKNEGGKKQT